MTLSGHQSDVLVVGGGVIGLSIAYDLVCRGLAVTLLDRGDLGREASWAGAGVLPPASWYVDHPAIDRLALAAVPDHSDLSGRLLEETGVDDEYNRCGADYVETTENRVYLQGVFARWRSLGIAIERSAHDTMRWRVPAEAQVRNPLRLRALAEACQRRGVQLLPKTPVEGVRLSPAGQIDAVRTSAGDYSAGAYCFCAGAWNPALVDAAGSGAPGRPVRGQMLLLRPKEAVLRRVVHRYPHYAVPRRDGLVLVGATVEDVGFEKKTTATARDELLAAAVLIDPSLAEAAIERHWSGLRPASADALPLIGPLPGVANAWVASGHHRSGLQLAPPTARMIGAMIRGVACDLPTAPFDPARFARFAQTAVV